MGWVELGWLPHVHAGHHADPQLYVHVTVCVQVTAPAFYFLATGYQLCTMENLAWRRKQGWELSSWLYSRGFGKLTTKKKIISSAATFGIYPILLALACAVAFVSHFLTLPIEVLYQPCRLVALVTWRAIKVNLQVNVQAVHSSLKDFIDETWEHSMFGLVLVVVVVGVVGSVVVVVVGCTSLVSVVLLPLVYGVVVVFRLFVLAPRLWGWLRSSVEWVLLDIQIGRAHV